MLVTFSQGKFFVSEESSLSAASGGGLSGAKSSLKIPGDSSPDRSTLSLVSLLSETALTFLREQMLSVLCQTVELKENFK